MAESGTSTFPETATRKKVAVSRLCASTTNGTPRMRWTPWTARCWMDASCGSRWPGTVDPPIPTMEEGEEEEGEAGEEVRPGGTAAMDAEAEVIPPARDTGDAADPAAGAALAPEADPATASPGPGPTPDPSPTLPGTRRPRPSPNLVPGLDPGPGPNPSPSPSPSPSLSLNPSPSPSPGPGPEAVPLPPKEGPGRDPKASPGRQQKMEVNPRRAQHISNGDFRTQSPGLDPTRTTVSCCKRRSCVAVEYCWLAVKVACCSAECLDVSSILQNAPVTSSGAVATASPFVQSFFPTWSSMTNMTFIKDFGVFSMMASSFFMCVYIYMHAVKGPLLWYN